MCGNGRYENTAYLDVDLCGSTRRLTSNTVTANKVNIEIVKTQSCGMVFQGDTLEYCAAIRNNSDVDFTNVMFRDTIPQGTEYVEGSLKVTGGRGTPYINGREISCVIERLCPHQEVRVCFAVKIL